MAAGAPVSMSDPDPQDERKARPVAKSATAFRTISEVSAELGVPQHVLRFWETRFPQVKPLKRGGGRRYYRPEDVELLRRIQRLLYEEGYTIKGVQKLLRESRSARPAAPGDLFAGVDEAEALGLAEEPADGGADDGGADDGDTDGEAEREAAGPEPAPAGAVETEVPEARPGTAGGATSEASAPVVEPPAVVVPPSAEPPAPEPPASEPPASEPPRLSTAQRGRIQTVVTELRALREILRQSIG